MSLRQKAVRGVAWSAAQNWGSGLITAVIFLVLARLLDREDFGLFALASACVAFLEIFLRAGFAQALIQKRELEREHLDTAFWATVVLGAILSMFAMGMSGTIALVFREPQLGALIQWFALAFLIGSLGDTQQAIFQRRFAFRLLAVRTLIASVAGGVVGIAMAIAGYGVWSLVGQTLTARVIGVIALWTASDWRPGFAVSLEHLRQLYSFGLYVMGEELIGFFAQHIDRFLIFSVLGKEELGLYHVALRIIQLTNQVLTQSAASVALPTFSRLQHDFLQMRQAYYTATSMAAVLSFPAFLGIAVLAPELVTGVLGAKWDAARPLLQVLPLLGLFRAMFYFNSAAILASGKPAWLFLLRFMRLITNTAAILIALPWGIFGVAVAITVQAWLLAPIPFAILRHLVGVEAAGFARSLYAPLSSAVMAAVVLLGLQWMIGPYLGVYGTLGWGILLFAAVYAVLLRVLSPEISRKVLGLIREALGRQPGSIIDPAGPLDRSSP